MHQIAYFCTKSYTEIRKWDDRYLTMTNNKYTNSTNWDKMKTESRNDLVNPARSPATVFMGAGAMGFLVGKRFFGRGQKY